MRWKPLIVVAACAVLAAVSSTPLQSQQAVVAVRASRMFDARSGTYRANQVILIQDQVITDVGANLAIPAGARVIDLGNATVLPGMKIGRAPRLNSSHVSESRMPSSA